MSVEALEPSSEVAELPNKPLKSQKNENILNYVIDKIASLSMVALNDKY